MLCSASAETREGAPATQMICPPYLSLLAHLLLRRKARGGAKHIKQKWLVDSHRAEVPAIHTQIYRERENQQDRNQPEKLQKHVSTSEASNRSEVCYAYNFPYLFSS